MANADNLRKKSSVLVIFNNQSGKRYNASLNEIAEKELNKKVEGLYIEIDSETFKPAFEKSTHESDDVASLSHIIKDSGSKYFVYVELLPYTGTEDYNLIYHNKQMTANAILRIIDVQNEKELFNKRYSMTAKDSTDYYFIGNPSMARKALKSLMFRVGEAISVNLPL